MSKDLDPEELKAIKEHLEKSNEISEAMKKRLKEIEELLAQQEKQAKDEEQKKQ